MGMKKKLVLIVVIIALIGWIAYFDVTSCLNFKRAHKEYNEVVKNYESAKSKLNLLDEELKELQLQIENNSNNVSQTKSSTSP